MADLFDYKPPLARRTDPETSHMAAADAVVGSNRGRLLVLFHLRKASMTDFELADATGWQQTSIGKRRGECAAAGLVEALRDGKGEPVRRNSPSGSLAQVWTLTVAGRCQ